MDIDQNMENLEREIAGLLTDLSSIQNELLTVLTEKRDVMAAGDVQAMAGLQPREQDLCTRLQQCHERRAALLALAGERGMPADSIRELATVLPAEQQQGLDRSASEVASRMRLLQHQSLANWVLAQKSLLHVSQMLEIIATGGQIQPTYGNTEQTGARGSLVDQEV